jgi:predicted DNA-binding ribbon-helix-helix protein
VTATRGRPTTGTVREVRIPDELWSRLTEQARQLNLSRAELIRRVLDSYSLSIELGD